MPSELISGLLALGGVLIGGLLSLWLQKQRHEQEIALLKVQRKAEFRAEEVAHLYLSHENFIERSFTHLKERLGAFDGNENELRRILISAGAVRAYRKKDRSEWWHLLSRHPELIKRRKEKKARAKQKDV